MITFNNGWYNAFSGKDPFVNHSVSDRLRYDYLGVPEAAGKSTFRYVTDWFIYIFLGGFIINPIKNLLRVLTEGALYAIEHAAEKTRRESNNLLIELPLYGIARLAQLIRISIRAILAPEVSYNQASTIQIKSDRVIAQTASIAMSVIGISLLLVFALPLALAHVLPLAHTASPFLNYIVRGLSHVPGLSAATSAHAVTISTALLHGVIRALNPIKGLIVAATAVFFTGKKLVTQIKNPTPANTTHPTDQMKKTKTKTLQVKKEMIGTSIHGDLEKEILTTESTYTVPLKNHLLSQGSFLATRFDNVLDADAENETVSPTYHH